MLESILKHWTGVTLQNIFLQRFAKQQAQDLKIIMQSKIKSDMTNLVFVMVLNQEPKPEGNQLRRSKDRGSIGEICYNQRAYSLISCNWISTSPEASIHVKQVDLWLNKCPLVQQLGNSRAVGLSKTTLVKSRDHGWAAAALAAESVSYLNVRERFLMIHWHVLWSRRERLILKGY